MNESELKAFIESGDVKFYEKDESYRWQSDNSQGKKPGTLAIRHAALVPFDSETGALARREQIQRDQDAARRAFTLAVAAHYDEDPDTLTFDQAREIDAAGLFTQIMNADNLRDKIVGMKYADKRLGLDEPKSPLIDMRTQTVQLSDQSMKLLAKSPAIQRLVQKQHDAIDGEFRDEEQDYE